jgi:hypothetical protein
MTGAHSLKNLRMSVIDNRSGKILKFKHAQVRAKYNTGRRCVKTRRAIIAALCVS